MLYHPMYRSRAGNLWYGCRQESQAIAPAEARQLLVKVSLGPDNSIGSRSVGIALAIPPETSCGNVQGVLSF
jgi:hypothetical protein